MNSLETLLFPNTEIFSGRQFPLFLLFPEIHILQPVEPEETVHDGADIFNSEGLCQAHTPCPLGEDRDRFQHLIRDIRDRKDDYAAQLNILTVAGLSEKKSSIDDSSRGIVASLLGTAQVEPEEDDGAPALWQARLLLKIAEHLDREEEEVAMQMALLDDEEGNLFKALQGEMGEEEETLFDEVLQLKNMMSRPSAGSVLNRLKAWSLIYSRAAVEPRVWATQMEEAADSLLEQYEEKMNLPLKPFLQLELPANIGWGSENAYREAIGFRTANKELLSALWEMILSGNKGEDNTLEAAWSESVEQQFPKEQTGRITVMFYAMSGISCGNLLGKMSAPQRNILAVTRWQQQ